MSVEEIRDLKLELELGLWHIEKALRRAEMESQDMYGICCIEEAKDHILGILSTLVPTSADNNRFCSHFGGANCAWCPMISKSPALDELCENFVNKLDFLQDNTRLVSGSGGFPRNCGEKPVAVVSCEKIDDKLDLHHDNIRSGIGGFSPRCGVKPTAVLCKICDLYFFSLSEWKKHIEGRQHQVRLVGEEELEKMKWTNSLKAKKTENFFPRITQVAKRGRHGGGRWRMKEVSISKQRVPGRRKKGAPMVCELCNVRCNGISQFIGRINGRRHQMAVMEDAKGYENNI